MLPSFWWPSTHCPYFHWRTAGWDNLGGWLRANMGRRSRGAGGQLPPEFGVGDAKANCLPQISSYRYKNERSVAFKIRQNPFSADPAGGAHDAPPDLLVGWGGDTLAHTSPHSAPTYLRRSPCVPQKSSQIYAYTCQNVR